MFNKTLINFRPFFFLAVSVALGVFAGYLFYFNNLVWGMFTCLVFLLFTLFVLFFSGGEIKAKLIFCLAFLLIFIFGAGAFCLQVSDYDNANLEGHYYQVSGKVTEHSDFENGQSLKLERVSIKGNRTGKLRYGVNLYVYGDSRLEVGDIITFNGYLYDTRAIYENKLSATNIERGVKYTATVSASDIVKDYNDVNLFEKVNLYITNSLKSGMDEQEASVAIGMLLGSTDEMNDEIITSYRSAGVAHIFAVSGLHIGFLATALNFIFNKLRINRLVKAITITLILFFYSGVCGFSASSLRASVMSAVLLFSSIRGNRYDGLSSVGIACAILLVLSPIHLFCVGFQLSFVVVLGIILLSPTLTRLLSFLPQKLASSLGTVICAQVVGIPICLYAFNQFSTISILANLIFLPVVGVIFIALFLLALIAGFLAPKTVLFAPNYLLKAINFIITAIDYDIFIVGGFAFGIFATFYYLALILPSGIINLKNITKTVISILCAIVCIVGTTAISVKENKTPKAYVLGDEKVCATVVKNGGENIMVISDAERLFSLNRLERLVKREGISELDRVIFSGNVKDIQSVITRLNKVFELNEICYYGVSDFEEEEVIRKVFGLTINAFNDEESLSQTTDCYYALNGYVVKLNLSGKRIAIFSEFGDDNSGYKGLEGEYDCVIATDYEDFIVKEYNPELFICYRQSGSYLSAFNNGTVTLLLK